MTKWVVAEEGGTWTVTVRGRFKVSKSSETARNSWLRANVQSGDKIVLREPDGYLSDITRRVLK